MCEERARVHRRDAAREGERTAVDVRVLAASGESRLDPPWSQVNTLPAPVRKASVEGLARSPRPQVMLTLLQ